MKKMIKDIQRDNNWPAKVGRMDLSLNLSEIQTDGKFSLMVIDHEFGRKYFRIY